MTDSEKFVCVMWNHQVTDSEEIVCVGSKAECTRTFLGILDTAPSNIDAMVLKESEVDENGRTIL